MSPYANVDLSQIRRDGTTSFTLVLDDILTHQRSFCHWRGANARFCESDIDWEKLDVSLLHIGYVLLLLLIAALVYVYFKFIRCSLICGQCGRKMKAKGICKHCGALNE